MAEKKLGDVLFGMIALVMFIGGFSFLINEFDNQTSGSEGYGSNLVSIHDNISGTYEDMDIELQQNFLNSSDFSISGDTDTDTRGTSQVFIMVKNSPLTIRSFIDLSTTYLLANKIITRAIIIFFFSFLAILALRFWRPGGI